MPTLIAGGMGGKLKHGPTGRYVQLAGYDWSQVLITMAHAMGVTSINKLGDVGRRLYHWSESRGVVHPWRIS
jgi:hypothetical protein